MSAANAAWLNNRPLEKAIKNSFFIALTRFDCFWMRLLKTIPAVRSRKTGCRSGRSRKMHKQKKPHGSGFFDFK
jgi:hypothetical protein